MNNAIFHFEYPDNEPIKSYAPGTSERASLQAELNRLMSEEQEICPIIGGKAIKTGNTAKVTMPTNHKHVLATYHKVTEKEVQMAIEASQKAHKIWSNMPHTERASIILKIADLIAYRYRDLLNAATMLGQGKSPMQAEIDSACETIDFLRFNANYMSQIYADQPMSSEGVINRLEYRPLEGFVFAITPFNFTAIASNLTMSPVLMGNVTLWKPATTALLSNWILMKIYKEAGLPDGVVNFLPGSGNLIGKEVFESPIFAGVHFTGSTAVFQRFWNTIGQNIQKYNSYPRIVGETGGKDFIFVHNSANTNEVVTAAVRGSFEYQGQKCSAASRMYVPKSMWADVKENMGKMLAEIKTGCVTDFTNFHNAVIDGSSFDNIMRYINKAKESKDADVIFGGNGDKSVGYFVEPTVIECKDPHFITMEEEIFGPVLSVYVYEDDKYEEALELCDSTSPYALTGAIFGIDRSAVNLAIDKLRFAAGNFYINDKPTGAVVGQQPFGGARASGTNDKAGSYMNLIRWTNMRTMKEALVPATDYKYPFLEADK
ncbi:MAG: L-glutamate gamma-semialdehyde dehydrogenase [Bacteroidota bacterium]|nr:L-glutamate gamma-semialdehyde dehydrogenase [Bacteroidota bacterium]